MPIGPRLLRGARAGRAQETITDRPRCRSSAPSDRNRWAFKPIGVLGDEYNTEDRCGCDDYLRSHDDASKNLDVIELSFTTLAPSDFGSRVRAIVELNERFRQHAIGYQLVDNQIIRVDSQIVHANVVVPALRLLNTKGFEGPEEERNVSTILRQRISKFSE